MWKFLLKIRSFIKKLFDSKVFNFALQEGAKSWIEVDEKFGGPLDKTRYQDKDGNWLNQKSEAQYEAEKEARKAMWFDLTKRILQAAFPKYSGYTSLLYIILGQLGLEKKFT